MKSPRRSAWVDEVYRAIDTNLKQGVAIKVLPTSVAALVSSIEPHSTVIDLVNLDSEQARTVIVQAGAFAENTIATVRYTACPDDSWLGSLYDYGHGEPAVVERSTDVGGPWVTVELPASTRITLALEMSMHTRTPSYGTPFSGDLPGHA